MLALSLLWGSFLGLGGISIFCCGLNLLITNYSSVYTWELSLKSGVMYDVIILVDWLALAFMGVVLFVSSMVFAYSHYYMHEDITVSRFLWVLILFVFSMLLLILSPNMVSMLLGWDGLGLVSFCLVIYYQSAKSYGAGMITVLSNRIGDVGILLAIGLMVDQGNWALTTTSPLSGSQYGGLLMLAALTKSAQMPFSAWLPAAMAAPTPVSALVHSSTLVTAGVYVLMRGGWCLGERLTWGLFYIAVATMVMAGLGALFEEDLKKIIALSTLSQLGLMMAILSTGNVKLTLFHLLTHALFKSLLFLCAGFLIHQLSGSQDLRLAGAMGSYSPVVSAWMGVANYALCGVPFLAGFYSKDLLMEMLMVQNAQWVGLSLLVVACGLTVAYTTRLILSVGVGNSQGGAYFSCGEGGVDALAPLIGLGMGGVLGGASMAWLAFGGEVLCLGVAEKFLILGASAAGVVVGVWRGLGAVTSAGLLAFAGGMWFLPILSVSGLSRCYGAARVEGYINEFGWAESWGGGGGWQQARGGTHSVVRYQADNVKIYLFGGLAWVMLFVLIGQ